MFFYLLLGIFSLVICTGIPLTNSEFIRQINPANRLKFNLPVLYSGDSVECFIEICSSETPTCPNRTEGLCPPLGIPDLKLQAGQNKSLELTKKLLRERVWWHYWHNMLIMVLFILTTILLYYLGHMVEHLDPSRINLDELKNLSLPYDGSFGFPLMLYYRMETKLDFDDDAVDKWKKSNLETKPEINTVGWHDHSETPSDQVNERRRRFKRGMLKRIQDDEELGIIWELRRPSALNHPNFEIDNDRLREYLRIRKRFKEEQKLMKKALLEHDIALARRLQAGMRLMAKHNQMALTKRFEDLKRVVGRARSKKARELILRQQQQLVQLPTVVHESFQLTPGPRR